ncbi:MULTISPECIES: hypothetical protein [unclassified Cyanobium]|uniref:hypothetical protein n=1 Tax=unclassified Cyanobium TaxID=2627006 RepID=UPI0020CECD37|nr:MULTISPECIES: hypothetical protein [unclassified Cyanobium]MCP9834980.1 hypothetical protein [Cyanobium sp. La Preciosa 7G6]MCP9937743.1 hypothetical protein [Cyanobium sp. Aljojuca 7A6]
MGELSDRFGELMARMAKGDADLFRTVGQQNAAIRQLVEEMAPAEAIAALSESPQPLLPKDQCHPAALKARFRTAAAAHAHLEAALGPAPTKKKTWDHLSSVFANGAWPVPARSLARSGGGHVGISEEALGQLEARLMRRIDQLEERVIGLIETLLSDKP